MLPSPKRRMPVADDIDDEVFDEEDLAEGFDAELLEADDVVDGDVDEIDEIVDVEEEDVAPGVDAVAVEEEDDLSLDHDVELALDEVLAETMRLTTEPDDDEDAAPEVDDKTDQTESVLPKQDDEFRCKSCRLLKKMSQLADEGRSLCRDCV
jgi:hypothetical protein